jgi:hypothetical protein
MNRDQQSAAAQFERDEIEAARQAGLLGDHCSEREVAALLVLRRRWRQEPDLLDLSPDERRLKFARWLVEHGRLSEDDGSGLLDFAFSQEIKPGGMLPAAAGASKCPACRDVPAANRDPSDAGQQLTPRRAGAQALKLLQRVWSVVRGVAVWLFAPDDRWDGYYRPYLSPYTPYPPYPPGRPWPSFNDPLLWRDVRHGR